MSKIRRVRRGAAVWRELFSRQGFSGLTVTEFCRREGINAGLFRRWRSALDRSSEASEAAAESVSGAKSMAPFIDLGALSSRGSRFEVRVDLGDGVVLNLVRG
jgi:putative transposase